MLAPFRWERLPFAPHLAPCRVKNLREVHAWVAERVPNATVRHDVDRVRIDVPKRAIGRLDGLARDLRAEGIDVRPIRSKDYKRTTIGLHLVDEFPYGARLIGPVQP